MTDAAEFPFDDTRKALVFALNADQASYPSPAMTTAMVEGVKKEAAKASKRRAKAVKVDQLWIDATTIRAEQPEVMRRMSTAKAKPEWWRQVKEARAGLILQQLGKLDEVHRLVLTGRLMESHLPCACRAPCCSGWSQRPRWTICVSAMCQFVKDSGDILKVPGKRGLSSLPLLRRAIVEAYFRDAEVSIVALARLAECSSITAAKHRTWIVEYLAERETEAWQQIAELLDAAGITGAINT